MKKRQFDLPVTGSASLLMSVILVVLAMLSLVSLGHARTDRRTADSAEKAIAEYYAADMEAEILKISADSLKTDELYAAFAYLFSLAAESISAGSVDTTASSTSNARSTSSCVQAVKLNSNSTASRIPSSFCHFFMENTSFHPLL